MRIFLQGNPAINAIVASVLMLAMLATTFLLFEPMVAHGIAEDFTVRQQINSEIAFKTAPNDVVMDGALEGLTGGNSFGTSTVSINTNNPTGYNMTIHFATSTAMQGENLNSDIPNYISSAGGGATPDYNFTIGANTAAFGYTVNSVTTAADVDLKFKNDGAACGVGSAATAGHCWYNIANAVTPVQIIDRTSATPGTGATSTITFQVGISPNPDPAIETGWYNATATLTAVTNA